MRHFAIDEYGTSLPCTPSHPASTMPSEQAEIEFRSRPSTSSGIPQVGAEALVPIADAHIERLLSILHDLYCPSAITTRERNVGSAS